MPGDCNSVNPISHGYSDQRLAKGGCLQDSKAIFSFLEPILGHMEPLLISKQFMGLIIDQVGKKFRDFT